MKRAHTCVKIRSIFRNSSQWRHLRSFHNHSQSKLNSQWIGVCQHMQHRTVIIKDYLLQWNKSTRILSSWGDNVYGYDFNGEMWRKMNHKMTGIRGFFCVQILKIPESDQSFYGFSATSTLLPSCHLAFIVFGSFWIIMSEVRKINE